MYEFLLVSNPCKNKARREDLNNIKREQIQTYGRQNLIDVKHM